ncbi:hypothetical protein [Flavobacterium sp. MK4S-17]|uniref:hypothetical protein n=1 Tax=Flavobacterium sp. MK4S-17 TaxID=2543737 RepID=UPI00135CA1FD|nr:hypothetical protein [Flavobacterium sp. MK4S-17]
MLRLLILFITTVSFSQDLEHLAKQDTIYLALKDIHTSFSKQYKGFEYISTVHPNFAEYQIIEPNGKLIVIHAAKPYPLLRVKSKKFLKKNGLNIINLEYVDKIGVSKLFPETLGLINPSRKIFFIFDEEHLKKKYINLKQVDLVAVFYSKI